MKRILFRTLVTAAAAALLLILALGQAQAPPVPFFTTPALNAFSASSGITLLVRQPDNRYTQLQFGITPPYGMLSSIQSLAGILSGSTKLLLDAAPGPPNVGLASQYVAIGDFKGDGSPGVAYVDVVRNRNGIYVYLGTPLVVFSNSASYAVGTQTAGVIAADFNRDGKTDIAVAYKGNGTTPGGVGILLNKGDGTFAPAVTYAAGFSPTSVAALDLNHDGILDLAVADGGGTTSGAVFVLLGRADGTFASSGSYTAGNNPLCVTIADFNGDSNPDLAVTAADNTATILLGAGNGAFSRGSSFQTGTSPQFIAAGDLNKDGKLDLVIGNGWERTVSAFLGDGTGGFQLASTYVTSYAPYTLILTDYNADGNLDIIQGAGDARGIGPGIDSQDIDILLGNGDGTFQGATSKTVPGAVVTSTFLATGDFNGDGKIDAILNDKYADKLYLFAGSGTGTFQAPVALPSLATGGNQTGPTGGVAGDFNGDGRVDLAVTESFAGKVAVLLNSATGLQLSGTFSSGGAVPGPIVAADFNGDAKLDLAVVNAPSDDRSTPGNLTVFFGGGNGTFQLNHTYSAGSWPYSLAVADLNGDGKPDLVVADQSDPFVDPRPDGAVYVFLNDGHGGFQTPSKLTAGTYPYRLFIGDLNGNGKPDLVVGASNSHAAYTLTVLLGTGNGSFQPPATISTLYGPSGIVLQDFNGDGKLDLVVSHCCGATDMTYLQGNGDGTFLPEAHFNGGANPFAVAAGDLNGDGRPDLIIGGTQPLSLTPLLNSAAIVVTSAASYAAPPVAPGMLAVIWWNGGPDFATVTLHAPSVPLPTSMGGVSVTITDANGTSADVSLLDVTPRQLNVVIPDATQVGTATVTVNGSDGTAHSFKVTIAAVAPGLFSANAQGTGFAVGQAWNVRADGSYTITDLCCAAGGVGIPINMGAATDTTLVVLYGTGLRGRTSLANVSATVGGQTARVDYAGPQPTYVGLDQVNLILPRSLRGQGTVSIALTVDGQTANPLNIVMAP
ncbi:MAG: FG-GAP-like repeat-containing protein [Bryobacteraceae bacterium]|jgi:uncharacterized protein (TIGR03437 family)